ncbi:MAG: hypothetical protein QME79_12340 [Bacillota bacterium]|nr:hypothetical protein [Bacillota bacterium]
MPIDKLAILREARSLGANATLAQVSAALGKRNVAERAEAKKARYRVELWDKKSPINGMPAEQVLAARTDIPQNGEVYLIYIDGKLVYFQPHPPDEGGIRAMTKDEALQIASAHVNRMVEAEAEAEIAREVLEELL